jgi:hypothetical protein
VKSGWLQADVASAASMGSVQETFHNPLDVMAPPLPGDLLAAVQLEWDGIELTGSPTPPDLPRPWEPATCTSSGLQRELATWLNEFVTWVNAQHTWNPDAAIPACWPRHPHLIHDLAVLADHRRRASNEPSSLLLEQWQRLSLPSFFDRMRLTVGQHCAGGHQSFASTGAEVSRQRNSTVDWRS